MRSFTIKTDETTPSQLNQMAKELSQGLYEALYEAGLVVRDNIRQAFVEGGRGGAAPPWKPLAESTLERGGPRLGGPLYKGGGLRDSIQASRPDMSARLPRVFVFTDRADAGWHDRGTRNEPRRHFMYLTAADKKEIDRLVDRELAARGIR
jgi:phage gpG-like protein